MSDLVPAGSWSIDASHSSLGFKIRYLGILDVHGSFTDFEGSVDAADPAAPKASLVAKVASLHTGNAQRDGHLQGDDFFDAANHPEVRFTSTSVTPDGDGFKVVGDLEMHGVTQPVELHATATGTGTDPWGQSRAAVHATGAIADRKAFGLTWNAPVESGFLVQDSVALDLTLALVKQG